MSEALLRQLSRQPQCSLSGHPISNIYIQRKTLYCWGVRVILMSLASLYITAIMILHSCFAFQMPPSTRLISICLNSGSSYTQSSVWRHNYLPRDWTPVIEFVTEDPGKPPAFTYVTICHPLPLPSVLWSKDDTWTKSGESVFKNAACQGWGEDLFKGTDASRMKWALSQFWCMQT